MSSQRMLTPGIKKEARQAKDGIDGTLFALWLKPLEYTRAREGVSEGNTPVRPYKTP